MSKKHSTNGGEPNGNHIITRRTALGAIGTGAAIGLGGTVSGAQETTGDEDDPTESDDDLSGTAVAYESGPCPGDLFPIDLVPDLTSYDGRRNPTAENTDPSVDVGESVDFEVSASNSDVVEDYYWYFYHQNADRSLHGGPGKSVSDSFTAPGPYRAQVVATLVDGNELSSFYGFSVRTPEVVVAESPDELSVGTGGSFVAGTDPEPTDVSNTDYPVAEKWTWEFADESGTVHHTETGEAVTVDFEEGGTYTATVAAEFLTGGTKTAETTVEVTESEQTIGIDIPKSEIHENQIVTADVVFTGGPVSLSAFEFTVSVNDPVVEIGDTTVTAPIGDSFADIAPDRTAVHVGADGEATDVSTGIEVAKIELIGTEVGETSIEIAVDHFVDDEGTTVSPNAEVTDVAVVAGPPEINGNQPMDLSGDNLYEDIDGSGATGSNDVVIFFEQFEDPAISDYPEFYDFSGSGSVGFDDVLALFERI